MTALFLTIFFVGSGLTLVSALLGIADGGDPTGAADLTLDSGHAAPGESAHVSTKHGSASPINFQTIVAFLIGFGGLGYLVSTAGYATVLALLAGSSGGFVSSWLIYRFLRFLVRGETPLEPTTYVGIVGRLTVGIRADPGGTGELVYVRHGTRMVASARSIDGQAISRGEEVVVLRYEKGIVYVQPFRGLLEPTNAEGGANL